MYKFGNHPPRSLESFGVSGLLGEECVVFYENLFSTRHVGRFSDLVSARLREAGADELRLRTLLLFGVFEGYLPQVNAADGGKADKPLSEPLAVECGIDNEKIAIGVSFNWPAGQSMDFEGLSARISARKPKGRVETLLTTLLTHAHRVVVRARPENRRVEVVSILGIPGKMEAAALAEAHAIEVVVLKAAPAETPEAKEYIELGDLDYPQLLREEARPGRGMPASPTGEILVRATEPDSQVRELRSDVNVAEVGARGVTPEDVVAPEASKAKNRDERQAEGQDEEDEITLPGSAKRVREREIRFGDHEELEDSVETSAEGDEAVSDEESSIEVKGKKRRQDHDETSIEGESDSDDEEETRIEGRAERKGKDAKRVKGRVDTESESEKRVKGRGRFEDDETRISGAAQDEDESETHLQTKAESIDGTTKRVRAHSVDDEEPAVRLSADGTPIDDSETRIEATPESGEDIESRFGATGVEQSDLSSLYSGSPRGQKQALKLKKTLGTQGQGRRASAGQNKIFIAGDGEDLQEQTQLRVPGQAGNGLTGEEARAFAGVSAASKKAGQNPGKSGAVQNSGAVGDAGAESAEVSSSPAKKPAAKKQPLWKRALGAVAPTANTSSKVTVGSATTEDVGSEAGESEARHGETAPVQQQKNKSRSWFGRKQPVEPSVESEPMDSGQAPSEERAPKFAVSGTGEKTSGSEKRASREVPKENVQPYLNQIETLQKRIAQLEAARIAAERKAAQAPAGPVRVAGKTEEDLEGFANVSQGPTVAGLPYGSRHAAQAPAGKKAAPAASETNIAEAAEIAAAKPWNQGTGSETKKPVQTKRMVVSSETGEEEESPEIVFEGKTNAKKAPPTRLRVADSAEEATEDQPAVGARPAAASAAKPKKAQKKGFLNKIWPFKKEETEENPSEAVSNPAAGKAPADPSSSQSSTPNSAPIITDEAITGDNLQEASDKLVAEIEVGHLKEVIDRAKQEADEIRAEIQSPRAKRWMEGLMGELVAEKARLHDIAKKLNLSIRQKEFEFKGREQRHQEDLRRKDDVIRQKTLALDHAKDQLSQSNANIERLRSQKELASEDGTRQKLIQAQNQLFALKEENAQLLRKVEELKKASINGQATGKNKGPSYDEFTALKAQYDRAQKQAEEFKKANQQLMERLNESKKNTGSSTAVIEDLKKKLEAAMKMATTAKRDMERFSTRTESLQKEEMRLKIELGRAMEEIKKLKIAKAQAELNRPAGAVSMNKTAAAKAAGTPNKGGRGNAAA